MKKAWLRMIATVLCGLIIVFSAAGAGAEEESARPSTMEPGPYGKYDPPIDITFVRTISDSLQKNVALNGMTIEVDMWLDEYRDRLGINVKFLWIAKSGEEFGQKLNLSLATATRLRPGRSRRTVRCTSSWMESGDSRASRRPGRGRGVGLGPVPSGLLREPALRAGGARA